MDDLFNYFNPATKANSPMISAETYDIIRKNADQLNSAIIYDRDYAYNYFGFKVSADVVMFCITTMKIIIPRKIPVNFFNNILRKKFKLCDSDQLTVF